MKNIKFPAKYYDAYILSDNTQNKYHYCIDEVPKVIVKDMICKFEESHNYQGTAFIIVETGMCKYSIAPAFYEDEPIEGKTNDN